MDRPKDILSSIYGVCVNDLMDIEKDKEELIKGIQECDLNGGLIGNCPYKAIIAFLKEQEKAKVVFGRCKDGSFVTECGHCGTYLDKAYSICPKCNKELDWNSNQT